jgi:hypothetical protein
MAVPVMTMSRRGRSSTGQTSQEEWRDALMAKGANIALVTYTRCHGILSSYPGRQGGTQREGAERHEGRLPGGPVLLSPFLLSSPRC